MDTAFLGTGWSFPPRFDPRTKQLLVSKGVLDIEESLRILMGTQPGERVMQPAYGCGLRPFVFEIIDDQTLRQIADIVTRAVLFYEPRVTLNGIDTELVVNDPGQAPNAGVDALKKFAGSMILLKLDYTVRTTNARNNMVYPLYLKQATNRVAGS